MIAPFRVASSLSALLIASCALPPQPSPSGPVLGYWHGEPPGPDVSVPEIVDLTLFGTRGSQTGGYKIAVVIRGSGFGGGAASGLTTWSGTWTRRTENYAGQTQSVIHLRDAPARDIDRYAVADDGSLQPTAAYVGRRLTKQEIALYSLAPINGTGQALNDR
jgi:hypothetical protein